jgi:ATP-dependent exoDNAse (exonuclease V) beta subunit
MIVGDVKQSIYRWRNGNMKLLLEDVRSDLADFDEIIHEEPLKDNFRSGKEIIKFNNLFFKIASEKLAGRINGTNSSLILNSYLDVQQNDKKSKPGGYVNVSFINSIDDQDYKAREVAAQRTIEIIHDALSSGYSQKDIMVLVRRNIDGSEAAHYLTDAGFKVVSNDSLLLTNSPKVKLLINIFKYTVDDTNSIAKTEILYNYLVYLGNNNYRLNDIFNDYKKTSGSIFEKTMPEEFFTGGKINRTLFTYNLYELTENLIRIFKLSAPADSYLLSFLDVVQEYSKDNNTDVSGFILWWDQNKSKRSIVMPQDEDAVRIMTIHLAKGLQSPVVIIPYTNWELDMHGSRDSLWASSTQQPFNETPAFIVRAVKRLKNSHFEDDFSTESALTNLDNLNLLYVAFTRAAERLHIICPQIGWSTYDLGRIQKSVNEGKQINAGQLIKLVLSGIEFMFSMDETNYEFGEKSEYKTAQKKDIGYHKATSIVSTNFYENIVVKPVSAGFNLEKQKKFAELKNRGIILHRVLSYIKSKDEIEKAIARVEAEGLITKDNEEALLSELVEIMKMTEVSKWFSSDWEVKSEAELLLPSGEVYRPDRVLLKDKKAIVIDYKTGAEKKEYSEQINKYADVLKQIGCTVIEKYIFYITPKKIVKV